MIGLVYRGNREEGIRVMLYKSYKTVMITKRTPYRFTERDNTSVEAANYYAKLSKLGIKISNNEEDFSVGRKVQVSRVQKLEAEVDKQLDVTAKPATVESKVEDTVVDTVVETTDSDKVDELAGNQVSEFSELNEAELGEYLEMNFDKSALKNMIQELGLDIHVGRKSESTIISELVSNHLDKVKSYLASK